MTSQYSHPKLIVTCRELNPEPCEHEIGNVLYARDPFVSIVKAKYPGLLFVYTGLSADKAYASTVLREYGYVENIIPVQCILKYPFTNEEFEKCIDSIHLPEKVKVKVRSRGTRGISNTIYRVALDKIKSRGVLVDPGSSHCLFIEIIDQHVYVGLGYCRSVFKGSYLR